MRKHSRNMNSEIIARRFEFATIRAIDQLPTVPQSGNPWFQDMVVVRVGQVLYGTCCQNFTDAVKNETLELSSAKMATKKRQAILSGSVTSTEVAAFVVSMVRVLVKTEGTYGCQLRMTDIAPESRNWFNKVVQNAMDYVNSKLTEAAEAEAKATKVKA